MQYGTEPTITDTAGHLAPEHPHQHRQVTAELAALLPDSFKRDLAELGKHRQPIELPHHGRGRPKPALVYRGRPVLVPGKRKAGRHPWADRLEAARTGGFVVDQTHPDTNLIVGSCYSCGDRFGFYLGDATGEQLFEQRSKTHRVSPVDGIRGCARGVVA